MRHMTRAATKDEVRRHTNDTSVTLMQDTETIEAPCQATQAFSEQNGQCPALSSNRGGTFLA